MICNNDNVNHVKFRLFEPGKPTKSGIEQFKTADRLWDGWYHKKDGNCYLEPGQISQMIGNPPEHFEQWVNDLDTWRDYGKATAHKSIACGSTLYDLYWVMRYFTHCRNEGNPQALTLLYHLNLPDLPTLIKQHA